MSHLICPICKSELKKDDRVFSCDGGHSYDIAKQGYVNLLPVNKKHSLSPGDSKEMVLSRRNFLESGKYDCFANKIAEIIMEHKNNSQKISMLDMGCGEGYYDGIVTEKLDKLKINYDIYGTDISKEAVKLAAGRYKQITYAVASNFDLPLMDQSMDFVINVFSPMVETEIVRVLKNNGLFIYAVPGPDHLMQLKETVYENTYQNQEQDIAYDGLEFLERIKVRERIILQGDQLINLFKMTPYYLKSAKDAVEKLEGIERLQTKIAFDFLIFRKREES